MSEKSKNIDFLDNEGVFYGLVTEWLKLDDKEKGRINLFILENFQLNSLSKSNNLYWLGSSRLLCARFLREIEQYNHISPIKIKMHNLFDELNIEFNEFLYSDELDFDVGATTREQKEFFFMHLFLSLVREYFLILPKEEISLARELRESKPTSILGWLFYPITFIFVLFGVFIEKSNSNKEHDPKRIADNEYRVNKIVREIEKKIEEIEARERKEQREIDAKREKQKYLSGLISSINDL